MKRMIFNYIEPVFVTLKNNGSEHYFLSARCQGKEFIEEFTVGSDVSDSVTTLENALHLLSQFVPNKRRFFCSSRKIMSKVLTSENINKFSSLLIKHVSQNMFTELVRYFDVDEFLANIGITMDELHTTPAPTRSDLDKIVKAYNSIVMGDNDENLTYIALRSHNAVEDYKKSMTWVEQARGGQQDLLELFKVAGNHMLGKHFNTKQLEEGQWVSDYKMQLAINRETAIADIQEKSMLNTAKIFIDIDKDGNTYKINTYSGKSVRTTYNIDPTSPNIDPWPINGVISPRRAFIGYGSKTLEYINEIIELSSSDNGIHELFVEIAATYIDISKPFEKVFVGKGFDFLADLFGIKKVPIASENICALDEAVFKDVKSSIEKCGDACYTYLVPLAKDKFQEIYKPFLNAVFGQSFKYFYSVSPEVSI